jgi:hypothetical protein
MWLRGKRRNKRHERARLLEVKMRSRQARANRVRAAAAAIGIVGSLALVAVAGWQIYWWLVRELVIDNEAYNVRRVEVSVGGRLRPEQILKWARVRAGSNLLGLDLARIRNDLELMPWIRQAEADVQRPDLLRIVVRERDPLAQVVLWRHHPVTREVWAETNYLDATGFVLPPLTPEIVRPGESMDFCHLTRITGVSPLELQPGRQVSNARVCAALRLIEAYEASGMFSLVDLEEIDAGPIEDALVGTLRGGTRLRFAPTDFERQMRRWRSIHDKARSLGRALSWVDLSVTNNVPARWVVEEATNSAPASERPSKSRKRHV